MRNGPERSSDYAGDCYAIKIKVHKTLVYIYVKNKK